jgi:long-chain acyl-CoA synthetase
MEAYKTIYEYFFDTVQRSHDRVALKYKKDGKYHDITYGELNRAVDELACGLTELGIVKGDRVAIYSYNRPEWAMSDLAILKLGAVVIPIYHTLPAATVSYILRDAEVKALFVESPELFKIVEQSYEGAAQLRHIVTLFPSEPGRLGHALVGSFANLRREGSAVISKALQKPLPRIDALDVATVVYTSGTTGEPKGAMLTHKNIASNAWTAIKRFQITENDSFVSFLPLCHLFERTGGYYTIIFSGGTIAYVESLQTVAEDVKTIRPTVLISVPRMLEKVYEAVSQRVESGSAFKRGMVIRALKTFNRYAYLKDRRERIPWTLKVRRRLYKSLVVDKFHEISGGRMRLICSGGAPLSRRLARIFHNLEFKIIEGYGLTEASPIVSASTLEEFRIGTVGKPLDDVEVKIGPDSEVLVRGPNVMRGYLNKPDETARMIDPEGWLHTGDQGRLDEKGNLTITGRIKELIVTSYGKNIAPVPIEQEISRSPYVEQAIVYGDRCAYLSALVVPKRDVVEKYAREHRINAADYPELLKLERIRKLLETEVFRLQEGFAPFEQVKVVSLIPEPFTVENGLLTPTLKMRRPKILERWRAEAEFTAKTQSGIHHQDTKTPRKPPGS